ncbi:MAG TPA: histidine--tRNA ligase [Candidatus Diapherotrites archaeon]|jgi:histidyl-tRNA synthetase|nr:histidine--tRNA ligase [Candidatus Diapherotrites archaeon]
MQEKSKNKLELARGFRDFPPEEKILRDKILSEMKKVFEIYGFVPLETPIVERLDVMTLKSIFCEQSDVVSEIYTFKDQGGRELGLRYELTFQLARFVAMNPQLRMPFKRYQIGTVYRDGPIKAGRYREFYQCDVDIVGVPGVIADAEIISLLNFLFKCLNLEVNIEVNSRKLLNDVLDWVGIPKPLQESTIISLDKLKKIGKQGVLEELQVKGIDQKKIDCLLDLLCVSGNNLDKLNFIKKIIGDTPGINELNELFEYLSLYNVDFIFLPSLARGLAYYTGPIWEIFLKNENELNVSLAGGGRWDNMIGKYVGDEKINYPATGVGIGFEPIMELIKKRDGLSIKTTSQLFIVPINTQKECIKYVEYLRSQNINVSMDLLNRSTSKNVEYANALGIPFVGFIGVDELNSNKLKIKNMKTGEEKFVPLDEVKSFLNS